MSYPVSSVLERWVERLTGAPRFIDTDHGYIHDGLAFQVVFNGFNRIVYCKHGLNGIVQRVIF